MKHKKTAVERNNFPKVERTIEATSFLQLLQSYQRYFSRESAKAP